MRIRTATLLFSIISLAVIVFAATSFWYARLQINQGLEIDSLMDNLRTEAAELSNVTADYLLYREKRSINQWQKKHQSLGHSLDALSQISNISIDRIELDKFYHSAQRMFSILIDPSNNQDRDRQAASQLFLSILEIQNEIRFLQTQMNTYIRNKNRIIMFLEPGAFAILTLLTLSGLSFIFIKVLRPLTKLETAATNIAAGKSSYALPEYRNDEIGQLTHAFQVMIEKKQSYAERLESANLDLKNFNFIASHDLQEPLRIMLNYVGMLKEDLGPDLTREALEDLKFIQSSAERMRLLIKDVLAYIKIRDTQISMQTVDMNRCLHEVVRSLKSQIDATGAQIEWNDLPDLQGDQTILRYVFHHLVANAIKFRLQDVPLKIGISAQKTEEGWEIRIKDNGIGIKPQYREQIFQPFKRLHSYSKYDGTGIGLAIVQESMKCHGGHVRVEDAPPQGSVFVLWFPPQSPII
ncbi:sensor histidine kinase [Magnetococcales bacterium HHB-1]